MNNVMVLKSCLLLLSLTALIGCKGLQQQKMREDSLHYFPSDPPPVVGGGLYQKVAHQPLLQDRRAYRIGDPLTVRLDEQTQSSKQASTQFGKDASADIKPPTLFGRPLDRLSGSVEGSQSFKGSATSAQQNRLSGVLTVQVVDVSTTGLLLVKGERRLTLNQGDEVVMLSGIVRPEDIDPDNSVSSQRIANARITFSGEGMLHEANQPSSLFGLLGRLF